MKSLIVKYARVAKNVNFNLSIFERYLYDNNFKPMSFGSLNITPRG